MAQLCYVLRNGEARFEVRDNKTHSCRFGQISRILWQYACFCYVQMAKEPTITYICVGAHPVMGRAGLKPPTPPNPPTTSHMMEPH